MGGHVLQSYEWGEFKRRQGWGPSGWCWRGTARWPGAGQFLAYYGAGPFVPWSLWYCTKGPWLPWKNEEAVRVFFEGVVAVAEREGAHTVKIEPEVLEQEKNVKDLLDDIGFRKARYDLNLKTTLVVDLEPTEEELLARMKGKTRYNVRLAARKGVEVIEPEVEDGFGPACYSGLGHLATTEASVPDSTDEAQAALARELCMLGQDYEALHYCVIAAARQFVYYYNSEAQAKELCEPLTSADLRAVCLQRTEEQTAKQQYRQESTL